MKSLPWWNALLLCLVAGSCAKTPTDASKFTFLGSGSFSSVTHSLDQSLYPSFSAGPAASGNPALFDTTRVDTTNVGTTFLEETASDTDFVHVAAALTDGAPSHVCAGSCDGFTCTATCSDEKSFFGLAGNDFAPARVEQVTLRVDSTRVDDGGLRRYFFTLTVYGTR